MRNYSTPEHEALAKIRPRNGRERRQIANILAIVAAAVLLLSPLFYLKQKYRENVEQNWQSASANIEDVHTKEVAQINSQRGGTMLYDMEVLVKYNLNGRVQEKWIAVQRPSESQESANFDASRWKGRQCIVHWSPSNPDQVIADVN